MSKRELKKYPKSISIISNGKYNVRIWSKIDKKLYAIGTYTNLQEAVAGRDNWLISNYSKVEGYLPRGITINKKLLKKFIAQFSYGSNYNFINTKIGTYETLQEAIDARREYILSLI